MRPIQTATRAPDLFGAGLHGFRDGDIPGGIPPTDFNADWCNQVQQELINVIRQSGLAPSAALTQLTESLSRLYAGGLTTITASGALTADMAGLVLVDASAGAVSRSLPDAAAANGRPLLYRVVRTDTSSNAATLTAAGGNTFEGGSTSLELMGRGATVTLQSNGQAGAAGRWFVLGRSVGPKRRALAFAVNTPAANQARITVPAQTFEFRNATLGNGGTTVIAAGDLTLDISAGATLGGVNGVATRLAVVVANNAGTPVVAVANVAGGLDMSETGLISPTAMSAAADANNVWYAAAAASNLPYEFVGFVDSTQATAGDWATAATLVAGASGVVGAQLMSMGHGQTWQNVTGSRALSTTYYNSTGKPIMVSATAGTASSGSIQPTVGGVALPSNTIPAGGVGAVTFVVPPGAGYSIASGQPLVAWAELR